MNDQSILETIEESFKNLVNDGVEFLPNLLVALVLVIVGSMVAGWITKLLGKALAGIEKNSGVKSAMKHVGFNIFSITDFGLVVLRWAIMIIFYSAAVDVLGLQVLTDTFDSLLAYLPKIFAAALVVGVTLLIGNIVRDVVSEAAKNAKIASHKTLAGVARIVVLVFGIPLAAAQLGLDLTIINNNVTVIVAGIMLAFGLAFGMGGRDVASKIIDDMYKSLKK